MSTLPPIQYREAKAEATAPATDPLWCPKCSGTGYNLPPEWSGCTEVPESGKVPAAAPILLSMDQAGIVFHYGRPCDCAAGKVFAEQQKKWNLPILPRETERLAATTRATDPWPPPHWCDQPPPKEKKMRVAYPTQQEIDNLKKQQEENRKGAATK